MEMHEDKNLFSETPAGKKEISDMIFGDIANEISSTGKAPAQEAQDKPSPGTKVIFEEPERGNRREYTGFTTEMYQSGSPFGSQTDNKEKNVDAANSHTGGQAFEQKLREKNAYPKKRPAPEIVVEEKIDEKELLRRRYNEYIKSGNLPKAEDVAIDDIDSMDVEEIRINPPAKKKKPGTSEIVRRCVLAVSLVAMVISVGVLLHQYIQYRENQQLTDNLNELIITDSATTEKDNSSDEPVTEETTRPLTVEEQWALLKKENPKVVFPAGIQLKYAKFYAINQDFVGYLSIDELGIGLPVLQSEEKEYYLRRNIYKKSSKYGAPFVPTESNMETLDRNTVIYGHNMSDGSIFAPLNKYKTLSGFKKAPVIQFDTIYGTYKWKIIAAFITNADKEDDNGYIFPYNFTKLKSDTDFMKYIELLKERSLYDTGVDVISSDKILTLSTCAYNFDSARFVVVARMVRPGESAEVDTSMAKENEEPHYPQAWYGKKKKDKKKNPYRNAEKWYYYGE